MDSFVDEGKSMNSCFSLTGKILQGIILGTLLAMAIVHLFTLTGDAPVFRYQVF